MSPLPAPNFHAGHWQNRASDQSHWHALDTEFGGGESFLDTLEAWRKDPDSPRPLFYTAFSSKVPQNLESQLRLTCVGLLPGVHRFVFEQGQVQLTLCIGNAPQIAKEIDIASQSICVDHIDTWGVKNLARLCKVGTHLQWQKATASGIAELQSAGFQIDASKQRACYQPHWQVKSSLRQSPAFLKNAIVIGVQVLEQGETLGAGASGLPAGILATHVSPDNNVLSRITRDGVRATFQRAQALLEHGLDWKLSGLIEHRYAGKRELPKGDRWPKEGHEWSTQASTQQKLAAGLTEESAALWHNLAGWLQPQSLVKAQLKHPNIELRTQQKVAKLHSHNKQWQCSDVHDKLIAQAPLLVLANAYDAQALINSVMLSPQAAPHPHLPATALRGQVTLGPMRALPAQMQKSLPQFPVNGHGSLICHLQSSEPYWMVGSSFQRNDFDLQIRHEDQISNMQQWAELMPAWQHEILNQIDLEQTTAWAAIRMALPERGVIGCTCEP